VRVRQAGHAATGGDVARGQLSVAIRVRLARSDAAAVITRGVGAAIAIRATFDALAVPDVTERLGSPAVRVRRAFDAAASRTQRSRLRAVGVREAFDATVERGAAEPLFAIRAIGVAPAAQADAALRADQLTVTLQRRTARRLALAGHRVAARAVTAVGARETLAAGVRSGIAKTAVARAVAVRAAGPRPRGYTGVERIICRAAAHRREQETEQQPCNRDACPAHGRFSLLHEGSNRSPEPAGSPKNALSFRALLPAPVRAR